MRQRTEPHLFVSVHEIHGPIIVIVVHGTLGSIRRQLQIVGTKPVPLSIRVGENPGLQQLIVGIIDSGHHNRRAKRQLLVLVEEIVDVLVQNQATHRLHRHQILRPRLRHVKRVEIEAVFDVRVDGLNEKLPLRVVPGGDGVVQVLCGVAVVRAAHL